MRVSIIGTTGSGRTVLLGLLYETLVRSATAGSEAHDRLRFIADPQVTKGLGDVRLDLLSGRWPSEGAGEMTASYAIEIGFGRRRFFGLLPSKGYDLVTVENVCIGMKDAEVIEGLALSEEITSAKARRDPDPVALSGNLTSALDSSVVVLLMDASKALVGEGEVPSVEKSDAFYATLLRMILNHEPGPLQMRIENGPLPVLFLTKTDVLDAASGGDGEPRSSSIEMLRKHFPLTAKVLEEDGVDGKRMLKIRVFFSGLRTEKDRGGGTVPSSVTDHGQVRLEYQHEQYASFVQFLGTMVRKHPQVRKGRRSRP